MHPVKTNVALLILGVVLVACSGDTTPTTPTKTAAPATSISPDENAALDALRKTNEAQATYFKINRRYALTYDELIEARLLQSEPLAAQTGYDFKLRPAADAQTYKVLVVPSDSRAAARHFFSDQTGVIHSETGKEATADSPEVQ
jgi:hypothetical protein